MSHEFETGFFVETPAWHGLGTVLADPPSVADAIVAAQLNWDVELRPLSFIDPMLGVLISTDHSAVVRVTDQRTLGVVGPSYTPIQNATAFEQFEPFVRSGQVRLEAAGSLRGGKRVWVLGRILGASVDVVKRDRVDQFILLANAHDGTMCAHYGFTGVRVVCQNTLSLALSEGQSRLLRIRHTKGAKDALQSATAILDAARGEFVATAKQLQFLATKGCDEDTLKRYVREVFAIKPQRVVSVEAAPEEPAVETEAPAQRDRLCARILELAAAGRGTEVQGVRGTFWGAYNAITEYVTHERGRSADVRVDSQWFGQGAQLSKRALKVGMQLAQAA